MSKIDYNNLFLDITSLRIAQKNFVNHTESDSLNLFLNKISPVISFINEKKLNINKQDVIDKDKKINDLLTKEIKDVLIKELKNLINKVDNIESDELDNSKLTLLKSLSNEVKNIKDKIDKKEEIDDNKDEEKINEDDFKKVIENLKKRIEDLEHKERIRYQIYSKTKDESLRKVKEAFDKALENINN